MNNHQQMAQSKRIITKICASLMSNISMNNSRKKKLMMKKIPAMEDNQAFSVTGKQKD